MSREQISHMRVRKDAPVWPVPEGKAAEQKKVAQHVKRERLTQQEGKEVRVMLDAIQLKADIPPSAEEDVRLAEAIIQGLRNPKDEEERHVYASMLESLRLKYAMGTKTER